MPFASFFKRKEDPIKAAAAALYAAAVQQARDPRFYRDFGVPDTVDGRFDMIVIHAMLIMRRLREVPAQVHTTGQHLFDLMFTDMDRSLRELGVGDMSVGKHVKKMAKAFYGRAEAYEGGLDGGHDVLVQALRDNLYRHTEIAAPTVDAVADYLRRADAHLAAQPVDNLVAGRVDFAIPVSESPADA